jgi:hypothetical protein
MATTITIDFRLLTATRAASWWVFESIASRSESINNRFRDDDDDDDVGADTIVLQALLSAHAVCVHADLIDSECKHIDVMQHPLVCSDKSSLEAFD